jgi:hypothetical protein
MIRPRKQIEPIWRGLIAYVAFLALIGVIAVLGTSPNQPWGWAPSPAATAFTIARLALILASLASIPIIILRRDGNARFVGLVIIITTTWLFLVFLGVDWRLGWPLQPWGLVVWYFLKPLEWLIKVLLPSTWAPIRVGKLGIPCLAVS